MWSLIFLYFTLHRLLENMPLVIFLLLIVNAIDLCIQANDAKLHSQAKKNTKHISNNLKPSKKKTVLWIHQKKTTFMQAEDD